MSEEKKAVEIKEEELEKVAGGNLDDWMDIDIECPQCGHGARAIKDFYHDCYYEVYCEMCGFYASKL